MSMKNGAKSFFQYSKIDLSTETWRQVFLDGDKPFYIKFGDFERVKTVAWNGKIWI